MGRTKIEWANYNGKDIFVRTLSKEDYDSEYKGKLTCIHGCNARIRFTERKMELSTLVHGMEMEKNMN